jgi:hypothetical protein
MHIAEVNCAGRYTKIYSLLFVLLVFDISYVAVIRIFKKHDKHKDPSLLGSNRTCNSSRLADLIFKQPFGQFQDL